MKPAPRPAQTVPPGYRLLGVEGGRVRFHIPEAWVLLQINPIELYNARPPDDDARLLLTIFPITAGDESDGLLPLLLEQALTQTRHAGLVQPEIRRHPRADMEFVWAEQRFIDPTGTAREAFSRVGMARGTDLHVLMVFDFWVDQAGQFVPVWDELARSLELDRAIDDPTRGPMLE